MAERKHTSQDQRFTEIICAGIDEKPIPRAAGRPIGSATLRGLQKPLDQREMTTLSHPVYKREHSSTRDFFWASRISVVTRRWWPAPKEINETLHSKDHGLT